MKQMRVFVDPRPDESDDSFWCFEYSYRIAHSTRSPCDGSSIGVVCRCGFGFDLGDVIRIKPDRYFDDLVYFLCGSVA